MFTLAWRIAHDGITIYSVPGAINRATQDEWLPGASHWVVTLTLNDRSASFPFHANPDAVKGIPEEGYR
jgi:hypothetical protein